MGLKGLFTVCFKQKSPPPWGTIDVEEEVALENAKLYTYKELQIATEDFSPGNKIGEGGFGSVYKGTLRDGRLAAIKVLSSDSSQGVREFLTEIVTISRLEHENLVKLYGCCVEARQKILVYGYLENNSLAQTLLGGGRSNIRFSWKTRTKLCLGVARGLAYLHEEVQPHIIHRDIKASNILLDKDLSPKISDFGLAKLFPSHLTHVSTRVAGTLGYLAPEYAIRGQVTRKADVYSFGVLLMEIVSGRCHTNRRLPVGEQHLLERVWTLYEKGELLQLVDMDLEDDFDVDEASRYLKVGILCTQDEPKKRPTMSTVVQLLSGVLDLDDKQLSKPRLLEELLGIRGQKNISTSIESASSGNPSIFSSFVLSLRYRSPSRSPSVSDTILLDGCDFEHWLVVVEKPDESWTRDQIIDSYIKTLAQVVGSEEEARMKIYSVSTRHYFAFGALVSEELSFKLKELPGVRWVLPDSYLDVRNKDYGGEPFINGQAVPYDPKYHEEWVRNNARANERNRRNDRPRNNDRSRKFERTRMQENNGGNTYPSGPNNPGFAPPRNMGPGNAPNPQFGNATNPGGAPYQSPSGPNQNNYAPNMPGGNPYQSNNMSGVANQYGNVPNNGPPYQSGPGLNQHGYAPNMAGGNPYQNSNAGMPNNAPNLQYGNPPYPGASYQSGPALNQNSYTPNTAGGSPYQNQNIPGRD
ncbi:OLC1v1023205C1 [Oldenlandia corymbosa var. corymbosa]|uniref:OLC1v1023205C1 n=1 Tax=Oldenlandia corymbosa var. corymbosa TaxID=529605 RepID=A0AAV1BZG2_OLDCO|nr:OLC1v1023205C1 [Oldenlandia corymbosa var. corymbosa]